MKSLKCLAIVLLSSLGLACAQPAPASSPEANTPTPNSASPAAKTLEMAPEITVTDQDGQTLKLGELYSANIVLVYFYPKADTPGCTAQACSLRDAYTELTDQGVKVVGVSLDDAKTQKAFKEKYDLPFTLVADPEGEVADAFGVSHSGGFASRQAFLIQEGKVIWHDSSASTTKQAEDVLEQLKTLQK